MQLLLFNEIIHGGLRPWLSTEASHVDMKQSILKAKSKSSTTLKDIIETLEILLSSQKELAQRIKATVDDQEIKLETLAATIQQPPHFDSFSQYYSLLIEAETNRIYNQFLAIARNLDNDIDIEFQTGRLLKSIKVMTVQTSAELKEHENKQVVFVLTYLRNALLALYFSIQEQFKAKLSQTISFEDFVLLELEEDINVVPQININNEDSPPAKKVKSAKLSFQFKGDKQKLRNVITQLCLQYSLLADHSIASEEALYNLLLSKDIQPGSSKFILGCETTQFAFIIKTLDTYFHNLNPTSIAAAAVFHSKKDKPITRQNLYSSAVDDPKESEEISNIIHQLK